jgi:hypothetical protein
MTARSRPRRRLKPAIIARRMFFFVAGSLFLGFLAVFLNAVLALYMPRHFSMSLAVGISVAVTLWLLRLVKHPPVLLKNVSPGRRGFAPGSACTSRASG